MAFIYPATTRRLSRSGPTRTPLCWTQPAYGTTEDYWASYLGTSDTEGSRQ